MVIRFLPAIILLSIAIRPCAAVSVSIDFNDGLGDGLSINTFYQAQGVQFVNAAWDDVVSVAAPPSVPGTDGPLGLQFSGVDHIGQKWGNGTIEATFINDVSNLSIRVADVGVNGAAVDAYDISNSLIETESFLGTGFGGNQFTTLNFSSSGIRSLVFRQSASNVEDGIVFDNLNFDIASTGVPEPSTLCLGILGVMSVVRRPRRHWQSA